MVKTLPETDVVTIGFGWTGSILAYELTKAGQRVVAIERGPWRDTATNFSPSYAPDEYRYSIRKDLMLQPAQEAITFRNKQVQFALPVREYNGFFPGAGVGGAGLHWNGQTWRFLPTDFKLRSHLEERYGKNFLPGDMTIQDWGVSYDELEPFYDKFEKLCGISGKAGNLKGQIQEGGNPYEGWRSSEYPTGPMKQSYGPTMFASATKELGYKAFPQPSANLSEAYTNPLGLRLGQCTYCGFCERFGCSNYSKSSPQVCILPVLVKNPNFSVRTHCEVLKINLDSTGKRATGVTYVDQNGEEYFQPANIVLVCAYAYYNARILLLSGIGKPYDPVTGTGVIGRNYCFQTMTYAQLFFNDKLLNPFIAAGAAGMAIDDFNGDNIDHGPLGYVGGGYVGAMQPNARPILVRPVPPGTPTWGKQWKRETAKYYNRSYQLVHHGSSYAYKDCYVDLDPNYKDRFGRPLLRMTFDFHENEMKMAQHGAKVLTDIGKAMNADIVQPQPRTGPYNVDVYQTTHNTGGTPMGTDPQTSAVNRFCQSWDVHNVFVPGGSSVFPQNHGYNPTDTVCALSYWTAEAITSRYLKNPGPLT